MLSVSVALCTHNGEAFVGEQLRSIFSQTLKPAEIVVSDDASTDDTLAVVERVVDETRGSGVRTRVIRNATPLGVVANFEQAMLATEGELVALSDQDDVWRPDRLALVVARFEADPDLLLLHSDARLVDGGGTPLQHSLFEALEVTDTERSEIHGGHAFRALMRRNLVTGATAVVRRTLVDRAAPFPSPWVHDEWLAVVAAAVGRVDFVEESLVDYRQHGANQIGASKLGLRGKVGRLVEPRGDRNDYLLERATVLERRLDALGDDVAPEIRAVVREKVAHQRARAALSDRRLARLRAVLREARTGRYQLYSRGKADVVRDLVQPAG